MLPRLEAEERLKGSDRLILMGIGGVVFGGFVLDVIVNFAWLKAGALVMFVAWVGLIVVHELGHALAASVLGWQVCRIVIGMGRPVLRFRVAGVPVLVCRYPVGGHVVPAPRTLLGARWKNALIFLAGPAAEFCVLLAMLALVGFEALTGTPESFSVLSAQAIAVVALMGVIFNLIPLAPREGGVTDGLGFLLSSALTDQDFRERQALPYTTAAEAQLLAGQRERAVQTLVEGANQLADTLPALLPIAESLLDVNEPARVVQLLDPVVARADVPEQLQPRILAFLANALLRLGPERRSDVEDYTSFAMEHAPNNVHVRLARAGAELAAGRVHPAHSLLESTDTHLLSDRLVDARDVLLAKVELARGRRRQALERLERLETRGARGPELDLLLSELGMGQQASRKSE